MKLSQRMRIIAQQCADRGDFDTAVDYFEFAAMLERSGQ